MSRPRPSPATLAETIDRVTDRGITVDTWARLNVVDLDLQQVTTESRLTTASLDTYAQYVDRSGTSIDR